MGMLFKKVFNAERSKGNFFCVKIKRNSIINENVHSEDSIMHYKGCLSNYLFQLFLRLKGQPEENNTYVKLAD